MCNVSLFFTVCVFYVKQLQNNHIFQVRYFYSKYIIGQFFKKTRLIRKCSLMYRKY